MEKGEGQLSEEAQRQLQEEGAGANGSDEDDIIKPAGAGEGKQIRTHPIMVN